MKDTLKGIGLAVLSTVIALVIYNKYIASKVIPAA